MGRFFEGLGSPRAADVLWPAASHHGTGARGGSQILFVHSSSHPEQQRRYLATATTPRGRGLQRPPARASEKGGAPAAAKEEALQFPEEFTMAPESRRKGLKASLTALLFAIHLFGSAVVLIWAMVFAIPYTRRRDPVRRRWMDKVNTLWARIAARPFFRVEVQGAENLPPDDLPCVYVANHQSFLDIFSMYFLRRPFKWVSKASILKIPIIGWAMSMTGHVALERDDRKSQMQAMRQCIAKLDKGASMFFFPEGTRTKTGVMGEFKRGAFSIAKRSEVGIVPITVLGTGAIMPSGMETCLFPTTTGVRLVCHPVIPAEDVKASSQEAMLARARDVIASALPPELRGTPQPADA